MADFTTLETLMDYKIDYGGQSAAIHTSLSYGPHTVPYVHSIDDGNLVFKWDFLRDSRLSEAKNGLPPKWLRVHLFKPQDPGQKPPPPPVSDESTGFILRGPGKRKEESDLWVNHINVYYVPVDGVDVAANDREDLNDDRANISWPGKRRSHMSYYTGFIGEVINSLERIPLRVSAVINEEPQVFLILTEIKRTRRLKLDVFQYEVRYVSSETRERVFGEIAAGRLSIQEAERVHGLYFERSSNIEKEVPPPFPG